ncbi:lipopolysaccharide biosynthesis protein [Enterococcus sulfureus]|uniref:lipopolysaccharide biosynthesis protein n=1 Tax=Enterococcus TaxID=1350 RepID=UPI001FE09F1F|nr:lipopolysaccharide biosynthesis protein [Enterococcus sulfureus]
MKNGFFYTAIGKFSLVFTNLLVNAILSRILTPSEYGVVAIVQVFILFFQILVEAGIGPAIIQNKNLNNKEISILFNYSIIFAFILSMFFGFFGIVLAKIYQNNIYLNLSWVQSIAIFFNGLNVVPSAILNKNKQFKTINFNQILSSFFSGLIGIFFAIKGYGVYSLVFSAIGLSFLFFILNFIRASIVLTKKLDTIVMRKILGFSIYQFSFNFINYFSRNSDNILIGKFLGPIDLGNYSKAYQLLMMPNSVLLGIINPVLQPVLSDYQDDVETIKKTYLKIVRFLALIGISLSVFLSLFSKSIIYFIFGKQWGLAVFPFQILATTVWIQMTLSSTGAIFQSRNKTKDLFLTGLLSAIILVGSISIGILTNDLNKLSIILTVGFYINYFVNFSLVMKLALDDNLFTLLKELRIPILIGFIEFLVLYVTKFILPSSLNVFIDLLISGVIFVIIFAILLFVTGEYKKILLLLSKE